ncbi:MAG TPA: hypothetical protein VGJ12_09040 [Gemmatimonadaceae bacterium]|jgi:hypothetical protein
MSRATTWQLRHHRALALAVAIFATARLIYGALLATAAMLGQRVAIGILEVMRALLSLARG